MSTQNLSTFWDLSFRRFWFILVVPSSVSHATCHTAAQRISEHGAKHSPQILKSSGPFGQNPRSQQNVWLWLRLHQFWWFLFLAASASADLAAFFACNLTMSSSFCCSDLVLNLRLSNMMTPGKCQQRICQSPEIWDPELWLVLVVPSSFSCKACAWFSMVLSPLVP